MSEVVSDQSKTKIQSSDSASVALDGSYKSEVIAEKNLMTVFQKRLDSIYEADGVDAINGLATYETSVAKVLEKIVKAFYSFIDKKHDSNDTKEMVRFVYRETAYDKEEDLIESVNTNKIDNEKVLRHLVAYVMSAPALRKNKEQHDKLKNLKTVAVKLYRDPEVSAKTNIVKQCFGDGVEAYRTKSAGSSDRTSKREADLVLAKKRIALMHSHASISKDVWADYAKADAEAFSNHVGENAVLIASVSDDGSLAIRSVLFEKDVYTNTSNKTLIENSIIAFNKMLEAKDKKNQKEKPPVDLSSANL